MRKKLLTFLTSWLLVISPLNSKSSADLTKTSNHLAYVPHLEQSLNRSKRKHNNSKSSGRKKKELTQHKIERLHPEILYDTLPVFTLSLSKSHLESLFKKILSQEAASVTSKKLNQLVLKDLSVAPEDLCKDLKAFKNLPLAEAWELCWGIPYSLTHLPLNPALALLPNPSKISMDSLRFENFSFEPWVVEETQNPSQFSVKACTQGFSLIFQNLRSQSLLDGKTYLQLDGKSHVHITSIDPKNPLCVSWKLNYSFDVNNSETIFSINEEDFELSFHQTPVKLQAESEEQNEAVENFRKKRAFVKTNPLSLLNLSTYTSESSKCSYKNTSASCLKSSLDFTMKIYFLSWLEKVIKKSLFALIAKSVNRDVLDAYTYNTTDFTFSISKHKDTPSSQKERVSVYFKKSKKDKASHLHNFNIHISQRKPKGSLSVLLDKFRVFDLSESFCAQKKQNYDLSFSINLEALNQITSYTFGDIVNCYNNANKSIPCDKKKGVRPKKIKLSNIKFDIQKSKDTKQSQLYLKLHMETESMLSLKNKSHDLSIAIKPYFSTEFKKWILFKKDSITINRDFSLFRLFNNPSKLVILNFINPLGGLLGLLGLNYALSEVEQKIFSHIIRDGFEKQGKDFLEEHLQNSLQDVSICTENQYNTVYLFLNLKKP